MSDIAPRTTYTYELTEDQQELLLGVMLTGNYRRREVPYSLWSIIFSTKRASVSALVGVLMTSMGTSNDSPAFPFSRT